MDGNPRDLPAMLTGCTFGIPTMDHKFPVLELFGKADEVAHRRQVIADLEGAYRTVLRYLKSVDDDIEKERHSLMFNSTNSSYSYLPRQREILRDMAGDYLQKLTWEYEKMSKLVDSAFEKKFEGARATARRRRSSRRLRAAPTATTSETTAVNETSVDKVPSNETPITEASVTEALMNEAETVED